MRSIHVTAAPTGRTVHLSRVQTNIPILRVSRLGPAAPRLERSLVLYWMTASRRTRSNFALQHAIGLANQLERPLLIFEPLQVDYDWASERLHRFVVDGMVDNAAALCGTPVGYYPYVEPRPSAARGLLRRLTQEACVVVTDELPCLFYPEMVAAVAEWIDVPLHLVDGCGVLPLRFANRHFTTAASFRRFAQREMLPHLGTRPDVQPLTAARRLPPCPPLPADVQRRWPAVPDATLATGAAGWLTTLPIDQTVRATDLKGGPRAAQVQLDRFIATRLDRYNVDRNCMVDGAASGLSPYLHFGHVSSHEVVGRVLDREEWHPGRLAPNSSGRRERWWGVSPAAEAFLDQIITWRELGYGFCFHRPDYAEYESLPTWAQTTLDTHAPDERPIQYDVGQLTLAATDDPVWNLAQRQLVETGTMHNYLRMLWGKRILEWSATPRVALQVLTALNDRFALDGRDPNSYGGIFWTLGRFDRAWGPERAIFGKVRYMSSQSTARKLKLRTLGLIAASGGP